MRVKKKLYSDCSKGSYATIPKIWVVYTPLNKSDQQKIHKSKDMQQKILMDTRILTTHLN
jgi:hypothetical protein